MRFCSSISSAVVAAFIAIAVLPACGSSSTSYTSSERRDRDRPQHDTPDPDPPPVDDGSDVGRVAGQVHVFAGGALHAQHANTTSRAAARDGELILAADDVRARLDDLRRALRDKDLNVDIDVHRCIRPSTCLLHVRSAGAVVVDKDLGAILNALSGAPGVRYVERNTLIYAQRQPNDPHYPYQWHYPLMRLPEAWDLTTGGDYITGAVIDGGLLASVDLNRTWPGFDFVDDGDDGDSWDGDPTDTAALTSVDGFSHGTHVAGTMGANSDNGVGPAGVDWEARLLPLRVLAGNSGTAFDAAAAVWWAAGYSVEGVDDNDHPADVINCSFGANHFSTQPPQIFRDAFGDAMAHSIVVVAAGNDDIDVATTFPAAVPGVITVGAHDLHRQRAPYSNFGDGIDIMAPGGDVTVDDNQDGYPDGILSWSNAGEVNFVNGTSMAAPHISGLALLARSLEPDLSHAAFAALLRETANPDATCAAGCGAGRADARALLESLLDAPPPPSTTSFSVAPAVMQLGSEGTEAFFDVTNHTNDDLLLTVTATSEAVLHQGDYVLPAQETAYVPLEVDRALAPAGAATVVLTFGGEVRQAELRWSHVDDEPLLREVYVAVIEEQSGEWVAVAGQTAVVDDNYAFGFEAPAGSYFLVALGDDDGDGVYEDGESFGAYPNLDDAQPIDVVAGQTLSNLPIVLQPSLGTP